MQEKWELLAGATTWKLQVQFQNPDWLCSDLFSAFLFTLEPCGYLSFLSFLYHFSFSFPVASSWDPRAKISCEPKPSTSSHQMKEHQGNTSIAAMHEKLNSSLYKVSANNDLSKHDKADLGFFKEAPPAWRRGWASLKKPEPFCVQDWETTCWLSGYSLLAYPTSHYKNASFLPWRRGAR